MERAPLSYQQQETIGNLRVHETAAQRFDGVWLFALEGAVRVDCLVAAIEDLVAHHPALRTSVRDDHQCVHAPGAIEAVELDEGSGTADQLAQSLLSSRYHLDDVLSGRPLFRGRIHRRAEECLFSVSIHHLIYDGWSMEILWRDLSACYAARLEGRTAALPVTRKSYAEIAREQQAAHARGLDAAVSDYRQVIGDCDGVVRWPAPSETYRGSPTDVGTTELKVPAEVESRVRAISGQTRVPPFVVLMAATAAGISRVTGVPDILVGVDSANRDDPLLHEIIGFLLNTRVVRLPCADHQNLQGLVQAVREPWMRTADLGHIHYQQALEKLGSPDFVKVNMHNLAKDWSKQLQQPDLPGVHVREVPIEIPQLTWRDAAVFWFLDGNAYSAVVNHRLAAVSPETAARLRNEILDVLASGRLRP
ncbi:MAG TPA: condensation domain-containing protein [Actinoplanes sp.]|nr:condensation domain-containing protein [Actinoplanes sp.]